MYLTMQKPTISKVISKRTDVLPVAFHVPNSPYVGLVVIGSKNYWSDYCETKEEAQVALKELKEALDYDSIETMEMEGFYPERADKISDLYRESGRTCGTYSGLYQEYFK